MKNFPKNLKSLLKTAYSEYIDEAINEFSNNKIVSLAKSTLEYSEKLEVFEAHQIQTIISGQRVYGKKAAELLIYIILKYVFKNIIENLKFDENENELSIEMLKKDGSSFLDTLGW